MLEFTAFYIIFSFCFVFPPSAFVSAGLTISNLFDSWLGSEDIQFVLYQLRRTSATVLVHSLLPFGFFGGLLLTEGWQEVVLLLQNPLWKFLLCISIILPSLATLKVVNWRRKNWQSHPLVQSLTHYANSGRTWTDVASEINSEFRGYTTNVFRHLRYILTNVFPICPRIDKAIIQTNPISKTVITNSWIIKVDPYNVHAAHQNHVTLQLEDAEEHNFTADRQTAQYSYCSEMRTL